MALAMSVALNARAADTLRAVGTIIDNDPPPSVSVDSVNVVEGDAGSSQAIFTVALSSVSGWPVTVDFATADGGAEAAGGDYATASGALLFPPGVASLQVPVAVHGDVLNEGDETFYLDLSNPAHVTIDQGRGVATIEDDDAAPTVSISDASVVETDTGQANAAFTVALSGPSGLPITVDYSTVDGTAVAANGDYVAGSGTISFPPGTVSKTVLVACVGDSYDEFDESFSVDLSDPVNTSISRGRATGTIVDNDAPPQISVAGFSVTEGNTGTSKGRLEATLSAPSGKAVSVDYVTVAGTAAADADYVPASGTLVFPAGTTSQFITIQIVGDRLDEPTEDFSVAFSNPVNATLSAAGG
ncbi:MAG: hypothetical protein NTW86_14750 [Candidatus Sumerlaeota bacterium]|nr:hypothetical protein [Candidatus Sumerlaeota bacterium]